jgi:hypothetical protein
MTDFKPCVIEYGEAGITEVVLKDCLTVWRAWGTEGIELGYDEEGALIAIRVPGLIESPRDV